MVPVASAECHFGYIFLFDTQLMVGRPKVYFEKNQRSFYLVKEAIYPGHKASIFGSYLVKLLIINASAQGSALLFHKHWSSP